MGLKLLLLVASFVSLAATPLMADSANVIGWVQITPAGSGKISIVGHALGLGKSTGKFSLALTRKSGSNLTKTGQTGAFSAAAGETVQLSRTEINVGDDEDISIELTLNVSGRDVYITTLRSVRGTAERAL